jgi:Uma2 family endonuclease
MSQLKMRPRKTLDDYMNLPEGTLAELIEGEIVMSPSPRERHQTIVGNIHDALRTFVKKQGLGKVWMAPFDVHLPTGDVLQPDVLAVLTPNLGIVTDWVHGAPDLVIEVLSPDSSVRDRFVKRGRYAKGGVKEYWIVDDESKSVEVLKLGDGTYEPAGYFEIADSIASPVVPGLSLPVRDVFAE